MNKISRSLVVSVFFLFTNFSLSAQSYCAQVGVDYIQGNPYLDFGGSFMTTVSTNTELSIKGALSMRTFDVNNETRADFLVPLSVGFNFLFPLNDLLTGVLGIEIAPTLLLPSESSASFLMGPAISGSLRVRFHDNLQWFITAEEGALIGPPHWLTLKTSLVTGFHFKF